jgi:hypothetical protein
MGTISPQDLKCLQEHLELLTKIVSNLASGASGEAPKLKKTKETRAQGINRYLLKIEQTEAKKLKK